MPTPRAVQISLTTRIFRPSTISIFKKASRIPSAFLGLTSDTCFFLIPDLLSSKHWVAVLVTEVQLQVRKGRQDRGAIAHWWHCSPRLPSGLSSSMKVSKSHGKKRSASDSVTKCVHQHTTHTAESPEALKNNSTGF